MVTLNDDEFQLVRRALRRFAEAQTVRAKEALTSGIARDAEDQARVAWDLNGRLRDVRAETITIDGK